MLSPITDGVTKSYFMNIHVVISTRNGAYWIEKCLNSVVNSSIPLTIKVIDNASSDDTVAIIRSKFPQIELTCNEVDMGFAKANNMILRRSLAEGADYIFLLNQDAWVEKDTIQGLVEVHQKYPGYGILSPVHLNGAGSAMDFKFSIYCNERRCPGFISGIYLNAPKDVYNIHFVNGAFWLISRECLLSVGLFDPMFNLYGEDIDFTNRVRSRGFKIGIVPNHRGYHDRQSRPPSVTHERHIRKVKYICILKDTTKSFNKEFFKYLLSSNRLALKALTRLQFTAFLHELKSGMFMVGAVPRLLQARKDCRKKGVYIPE